MNFLFSALKNLFEHSLSTVYSASETEELYFIFCEEYLKRTRTECRMSSDFELTPAQEDNFKYALQQLEIGRPYQQILGKAEFFGEVFFVNESVLLPRPETEELVEFAIQKIAEQQLTRQNRDIEHNTFKIVDIGTGSGIIPLLLKKKFPQAAVFGLDISAEALEVAEKNAAALHLKVHFRQQDYLREELSGPFDVIISNPPYIGKDEISDIENGVKSFEPNIALFSPTEDALLFYRKIAQDCEKHLKAEGLLFLEINQKLGAETLALFTNGFSTIKLLKDLSENDRFIFGRKK